MMSDRITTQSECPPLLYEKDRIGDNLFSAALKHFESDNLEKANSLCDELLQAQPNHPDALHLKGASAIKLGDLERGFEFFEKSIEADPARSEFRVNLSQLLTAKRDYCGAAFHLQRAAELDPKNIETLHLLGIAFFEKGEIDEALDVSRFGLSSPPEFGQASPLESV